MSKRSTGPERLRIDSSVEAGVASIQLAGELDLASAPQLEESLRGVETQRPSRIVIDLGGLAFIDSTGLRLLLQANARSVERECELVLRPGDESIQRVFDLTGAVEVLRFEGPAPA